MIAPRPLQPGEQALISEHDWFVALETGHLLHQWGPALLVEAEGGLLRLYLRDDGGARRHRCLALSERASHAARRAVAEIEALSDEAARLVARGQAQDALSPAELAAQQAAGARFCEQAERLYAGLAAGTLG